MVTFEDLFLKLDMVKSKSEFRRLVEGKGAKFNDKIIADPKEICNEFPVKLSVGKKKHIKVDRK